MNIFIKIFLIFFGTTLKLTTFGLYADDDDNALNFESLLDLDSEEETSPDDENKSQEKIPDKSKDNKDEKFQKLERSYKDQQEFVRQLQEEMKDLKGFKEKLIGKTDEEKSVEMEKNLLKKVEDDPLFAVKKIEELEKKLDKVPELESDVLGLKSQMEVDRIIKDAEKTYVIDWTKDKEIVTQVGLFSEKARREIPKDVLVNAARLAGALKVRDNKSSLPFVEGSEGEYSNKLSKSVEDKYKERILKAGTKKILNI